MSGPSTGVRIDAAPVALGERVQAMDVLRGAALLGILLVNMSFFAAPFADVVRDDLVHGLGPADRVAWFLVEVGCTGKFISIFSFLFGAGIALQAARLDALRGVAATTRLLLRRLGVLALIGFVHATCIWYGDILWGYATLGWTLIVLRFLPPVAVAWLGAAMLLVSTLCMTGLSSLPLLASLVEEREQTTTATDDGALAVDDEGLTEEPEAPDAWVTPDGPTSAEAVRALGRRTSWNPMDPRWSDFERSTTRHGPASAALALRTFQWSSSLPAIYLYFGPHLLGMFCLGMAAARTGLLGPDRRALHRRLARAAIPAGLALSAVVPTLVLAGRSRDEPLLVGLTAVNELGTVVLALGYVGFFARLAEDGPGPIARALARTGRMAFTIYLSMSVLMTGLFAWWGGGLFGEVSHVGRVGIALATWCLLAAAAQLWLRVFAIGPMEWVWRSATYLRWMPLVRRAGQAAPGGE